MDKPSGKRTIYFVWNYTNWGGAQIYLMAIMKAARKDWNLKAIIPRDSDAGLISFLEEIPVEIEFLNRALATETPAGLFAKIRRQHWRIMSELEIFWKVRRFDLRKNILHIEIAPWQSWILLTAFSLMRANVFITLHNFVEDAPIWRKLIWKARLGLVSRLPGLHFFAANGDARAKMKPWVSAASWAAVKLTYTAVDPVLIDKVLDSEPQKAPKAGKISKPANFTILCVGQFIDRKGRWVFLEAAREIKEMDASLKFIWLAPHLPDSGEMKIVESYGLGENFQIVQSGSVGKSRLEILRFFRKADIFVLPSFVEGLPIALLEAMALGIPSISTNVFSIPEAVKHMETGILIEAGDAEALARAILLLKDDEPLRSRIAMAGQEYVLEHFDERKSAATAIEAYRTALRL